MLNELSVADLTDRLTLDIAKPMVTKLTQERIAQYDLTPKELSLLQLIVKTGHGMLANFLLSGANLVKLYQGRNPQLTRN